MGIILKEETSYEPIPSGMYDAVCSDIYDLGIQHTSGQFGDRDTLQVMVVWELPELTYTDAEGNEKPRQIRKTYTQSFSPKSNIRKDLESWRGKPFTEEELQGFDLDNVLGCGCQIQIMQEKSNNGKTYSNIKNIVPLKRDQWAEPSHKTSFVLKSDRLDEIEFLPEFVQNIIKDSTTYKQLAEMPFGDDFMEE